MLKQTKKVMSVCLGICYTVLEHIHNNERITLSQDFVPWRLIVSVCRFAHDSRIDKSQKSFEIDDPIVKTTIPDFFHQFERKKCILISKLKMSMYKLYDMT